MKQVSENLFECYNNELKELKASDFISDVTIYVKSIKTNDFIFIINLRKGEYKSFGLRSYVEDAKTKKTLSCMPGSFRPFTPYYIRDFINR